MTSGRLSIDVPGDNRSGRMNITLRATQDGAELTLTELDPIHGESHRCELTQAQLYELAQAALTMFVDHLLANTQALKRWVRDDG